MNRAGCIAGTLLFVLVHTQASGSVLSQEREGAYGGSIGGAVNAGLGVAVNPGDFWDQERKDVLWDGELRILADGFAGKELRGWLNILQSAYYLPSLPLPLGYASADVERSGLLFWGQQDSANTQANLLLDAGYVGWGSESSELTLGRQPVQLSVTFYFTPNDFFAPFAAQTFYRAYKPGVDTLRYEYRLADLTQFSLLGVLGYAQDPDSASGWSKDPDWERTSVLARYATTLAGLEWGLLGGVVRENTVAGGSLQGELGDWLGIRAEGHYRNSRQDNLASGARLSVGLEHRFASSLTVRLEQMYNGPGKDSIAAADQALLAGTLEPWYLGCHYSALDLGYEFTPLLRGEILSLRNWSDSSQSFSFYAVYSLADEAELALQVTLPEGKMPDARSMGSEFGMQPVRFALEYRHYF